MPRDDWLVGGDRRKAAAERIYDAATDLTYTVEQSTDFVTWTPASSYSSVLACANGTAAAARAVIFRRPGDTPCPAIPSWVSRGASP